MRKIFISPFLISFLLGLNACSASMNLISVVANDSVVVDGKPDDWQGDLFKLQGTNLGVGIKNDQENLYICLISRDQSINRQIMMNGLFVWFDEKGKTKKRNGIKYPMGNIPPDFRQIKKIHPQRFDDNQFSHYVGTEFEYYTGEDCKVIYPPHENEKQIELEFLIQQNQMIYEMKVPFKSIVEDYENVNISKLGIGIELGKMEKTADQHRGTNNPPPGSRGGRSGGMGGKRPNGIGGQGSMNRSSTNEIKKWIKVELSNK